VKPTVFLGAGRITGALLAGLGLAQYRRQQCTNSRSTRFGRRNALLGANEALLWSVCCRMLPPREGLVRQSWPPWTNVNTQKIVEVGVPGGMARGEREAFWRSERRPDYKR
jgi:hypothetical protein